MKMPSVLHITSFSNPKIKEVGELKEKKGRTAKDQIFIEGYREISRYLLAQKSPRNQKNHELFPLERIYTSPECYLGTNEEALVRSAECDVVEMPRKIFEKLSYRDRPDGLIAIAKTPRFQGIAGIDWNTVHNVLVIEGVEKPGNLGTILRTAEGAGVDLVLVTDPRLDLWNPNVIRASTGCLFGLAVRQVETNQALSSLQEKGYRVFAFSPEAKEIFWKADLKSKTALLFGSEQYGLSELAKQKADQLISLPMKGEADSLNLAMTVGIALYEKIRQEMNL